MALAVAPPNQDVTLGALAAAAEMSPFQLHRAFSRVAGETPKEFASRLRLGNAAARLLTGEDTVLRIALDCGFESHEGFTRAFRRRFAMTPSAYRARGWAAAVTHAQAKDHRDFISSVGPCVGLYRIRTDRTPRRNAMKYEISKKELAPQPVLVARRRVSGAEIPATIGEVLSKLFQFAQQEGVALSGKPITRYYEVGPGLMTIEPGMRVVLSENELPGQPTDDESGAVRRDVLPGGPAAVTLHTGPYDALHEAYAALETWMKSKGLAAAGAPWESYITDPAENPDPKTWKTEVFWPVK
jgi:AraC family transcriptional regulator